MPIPRIENPPVTCVVDCRDVLGEGCVWDPAAGVVWWLDMIGGRLHRLEPRTSEHRTWLLKRMVASMAVRSDGTLLVTSMGGLNVFDPATGALEEIARLPAAEAQNRCNDGAADTRGRFWLGTVHDSITPGREKLPFNSRGGNLYRIASDLSMTQMESAVGIANSPIWSPDDKTFLFVDSLAAAIYAYDFDAEAGTIANRRIFANPEGFGVPDGSAMDAAGYLWNARWDGGCVIRFAPDGAIDRIVAIPAERVTCCTFGGAKLDTLYVTTARFGLAEASLSRQPLQGGLFAVQTGVQGMLRNQFAG